MYDRILLPTDGSAGAEDARDHALDLSRRYDAELHVLFVVSSAYAEAGPRHAATVEALEQRGESVLDETAAVARDADVTVVTELRHGTPHSVIVEYGESIGADLIVMGTHGRTGIERYLLGSVTEKVVRTASAPVLTVRLSDEEEEADDAEPARA